MKTYKQYRKAHSKADLKPNEPMRSWKPEKKLVVLAKEGDDEKVIHFGDANMEDYTQHKDERRRDNYLKRAGGIRNSAGQLTKDDKFSANYWAMRYLWDYKGDRFDEGGAILLAPNGKPSNLTPEQYRLVRTKAFKDWFGDWENDPANASKVVDENGEPLVVYHGSNTNFNIFKPSSYIGTHGETDQLQGIYFTDNKESANWYALKEDDPRFLKEVFLNISNPFYTQTNAELKSKTDSITFAEISDKVVLNGYNGILVEQGFYTLGLSKLYLCFESNQIKLADGSNTTFDGNNPDIRYAGGGQVNPWAVCTDSVGREDKEKYESCVVQVKEKTGYKKANGGNIDSFWSWYTSWVKGFNGKAMSIFISKPNELHGLPITEDNAVVLDLFEKVDQSIDAKPYLREIITKADEYGVTIYLEPTPRYKYFIENKAKREKISKEYLIGYYEKFGFVSHDNGKYMKREPKQSAQFDEGGQVLLAPNGKPSNLTPEQYRLVRTKAFKDWFGDWENNPENASKVVDENGEPLVVYHGTGTEFYVFDKSKAHDKEGRKWGVGTGKGVFSFTNDYRNAESWASRSKERGEFGVKSDNPTIHSVFLNLRNPKTRDDFENRLNKKFEGYMFRPSKERDKKIDEIYKEYKKERVDGLISDFGEYTAFSPTQIKLADGTNTTFDGGNPDIRYADGGKVDSSESATFTYLWGNLFT